MPSIVAAHRVFIDCILNAIFERLYIKVEKYYVCVQGHVEKRRVYIGKFLVLWNPVHLGPTNIRVYFMVTDFSIDKRNILKSDSYIVTKFTAKPLVKLVIVCEIGICLDESEN